MTDLRHHGDRDLAPGLVDLAVNVRLARPPAWLRQHLVDSLTGIAAYPDPTAARVAVAARHGRRVSEALVTAGGAEAFTLVARALPPGGRTVVVHPQFTEPEVALATAGHDVHRVLLDPAEGFRLAADAVPDDADLVVIGNPTNPTSILHPAAEVRRLARPGRVLVVDEAFMDAVPGEPESLADVDLPGLLVVRSLTKTWGLAGLRAGYVVGDEALIARLAAVQPPWSVSTPALAAVHACIQPDAVREAAALAEETVRWRTELVAGLESLGLTVVRPARAPFVLVRVTERAADGERVLRDLRRAGWAVRRGDTFPGLGPQWIRMAVREPAVTARFLAALAPLVGAVAPARRSAARPANGAAPLLTTAPAAAGRVTLVGAGPGDAGLITVRGADRLAEADVVVTDRLVPLSLVDGLRPGVVVVDVAKVPGSPATGQDRINRILVDHALAGRRVVRLKGGDPYVFGRGAEEVEACLAAGVPVEVVPGVSSSLAVPALAGIPVTHRGLTQGFTVVSGHVPPDDPASTVDWSGVARSGTTVVLLMAVRTLPDIAAALLRHGLPGTTPAACVENGGTPRQRVLAGTLADIGEVARAGGLRAPAVTVIGAVAAFASASQRRGRAEGRRMTIAPRIAGLALGYAADLAFGDPRRWHPVAGFGRAAAAVERRLWADSRTLGTAHVAVCVGACVGAGLLAHRVARRHPVAETVLIGLSTWTVLGGRSLRAEGRAMHDLLTSNDLDSARHRLSHLAGRNPDGLDPDDLARATVESLAENTSDAVVAPMWWAAVAGVPGLVGYRAVNTLDAMIGHRSPRYARYGWCAARLDDAANLVPARLSAALAAATAPLVGGSPREALRAWRRDAAKHPSPNAGPVEAAFAGALGVRLGGVNRYGDRVENRGTLGAGPSPRVRDIPRAIRLSRLVGAGGLAVSMALSIAATVALRRLRR